MRRYGPGTDIAFLSSVIRYLPARRTLIQHQYVRAYTNAGLIVQEAFGFKDGLFSGYTRKMPAASDMIELALRTRRAGLREGR